MKEATLNAGARPLRAGTLLDVPTR